MSTMTRPITMGNSYHIHSSVGYKREYGALVVIVNNRSK